MTQFCPEYRGAIAGGYEAKRTKQREWSLEHQALERWLRDAAPGTTILDAPVGTGRFLPLYERLGLHAIGVDCSPDMLHQAAAKKMSARLIRADILDLPQALPCCDRAVCVRFTNWLDPEDLERALRTFSKLIRARILLGIATSGAERVSIGGAWTHVQRDVLRLFVGCRLEPEGRTVITAGATYEYGLWSLRKVGDHA